MTNAKAFALLVLACVALPFVVLWSITRRVYRRIYLRALISSVEMDLEILEAEELALPERKRIAREWLAQLQVRLEALA